MLSVFSKLSSQLSALVDPYPRLAAQKAREIDMDGPDSVNWMPIG